MILGIGTDVVAVARMKAAFERTGRRFLDKVFTEAELEYCWSRPDPWPHMAARFAAKEAVIKALGLGLDPHEIEIYHQEDGCPAVTLHGSAIDATARYGTLDLKVSLSHTSDLALACALALC